METTQYSVKKPKKLIDPREDVLAELVTESQRLEQEAPQTLPPMMPPIRQRPQNPINRK